MQLFEPAPDDAAAVLRRAIELGVNHIDTASFYGPGEVNRRIRAALAPYPDDLVIVSKVGARFTGDEPMPLAAAQKPAELRAAVEDDLSQLGLEQIPVVNLRRMDLGPGVQAEGDQVVDLDDQLAEMIALRDEGKIGGDRDQQCAAGDPAARAARGHRLRAERLQPARPFAGGDARRLQGRRHRLGAVLPARVGVPRLPEGGRQPGGDRHRRRTRRHAGPGRAGLAAGARAERRC